VKPELRQAVSDLEDSLNSALSILDRVQRGDTTALARLAPHFAGDEENEAMLLINVDQIVVAAARAAVFGLLPLDTILNIGREGRENERK
jgi:L-fucose mutarotase/ribose pyranase (RbsD/FucU family)